MLMDRSAGATFLNLNSRSEPRFLLTKGSIIFLKDSCPSSRGDMERESLHEDNHCQNVPETLCRDDCGGQSTFTKIDAKSPWNIGRLPRDMLERVHTPFTQKEVVYHLESFKSSREFLLAVFDAFLAHKDAYEKCGILYGDISPGNIFIRRNGCSGGLLNDWDIAMRTPRQPFRSGTWQFMSAALHDTPDKSMSLQDDMESFLWLVLYHILRYMNHNLPQKPSQILKRIFHENDDLAGQRIRGISGKEQVLASNRGPLGFTFKIHDNKPLTFWMYVMLVKWQEWYKLVFSNQDEVRDAIQFAGMSQEEAMQQHPFDDSSSPMRNHDEAVSVFQKVLKMTPWPNSDQALDALSPQAKQGPGSEGYTEHNSNMTAPIAVENPARRAALTKSLENQRIKRVRRS